MAWAYFSGTVIYSAYPPFMSFPVALKSLQRIRLIDVTQWIQHQKEVKGLPIEDFGASTRAASALRAAAFYGKDIKAVVSRGGRPDMALQDLQKVTAPTLLIVGGWDNVVKELNEKAY
jgi:pimeloyl-ACP methyl ester carboxylesterase